MKVIIIGSGIEYVITAAKVTMALVFEYTGGKIHSFQMDNYIPVVRLYLQCPI